MIYGFFEELKRIAKKYGYDFEQIKKDNDQDKYKKLLDSLNKDDRFRFGYVYDRYIEFVNLHKKK